MQKENEKEKNSSHPRNFLSGIRCCATIDPRQRLSGVSQGVRSLLNNGNDEIPDQVRDDSRGVRDDSKRKNGFTLIELLVVVLIIGILAAVAVPQYQKAVWKSRNTQLKTVARAIRTAEESYFLANGKYTHNFDELDIDLPLEVPNHPICSFVTNGTDSYRQGKDFEVMLNGATDQAVYVMAHWTKGPYKCWGFSFWKEVDYCQEASNGDGSFCEKIEKATYSTTAGNRKYYLLP